MAWSKKAWLTRELELLDQKMPAEMLIPALKLAQHFGHEWGGFFSPEKIAPMSINEIEAITYNPAEKEQYYIGQPIFSPDLKIKKYLPGYVMLCHTTGSGRLSWEIDEYGDIRIAINRPNAPGVIVVELDHGPLQSDKGKDGPYRVRVSQDDYPVYQRHVDALFEVLSVLLPLEQVQEACSKIKQARKENENG